MAENNSLQIFENEQFGKVRTVQIDGEVWFVGKDVAVALGYADYFGALKKHVDEEDKQNCQNDSFESNRGMTIINESGLYSLVLSSKLPNAKAFKRWTTKEVIPSVQKTGLYMTPAAAEKILDYDFIIRLATQAKEHQAQLAAANEKMALDAPKVEYFDRAVDRGDALNIRDTAKILGIGERKFVRFMSVCGYIYRDSKKRIRPVAEYAEKGWFTLKEFGDENYNGAQMLITFKGRTNLLKEIESAKKPFAEEAC